MGPPDGLQPAAAGELDGESQACATALAGGRPVAAYSHEAKGGQDPPTARRGVTDVSISTRCGP
jgi:hypothetical protein